MLLEHGPKFGLKHDRGITTSYNATSRCELPQAAQSIPTVPFYQSNDDS